MIDAKQEVITVYDCPQCGEQTMTLFEGYCCTCRDQNQAALDAHNLAYDQWERMTAEQRDAAIRFASRSTTS